MPFVAIVNYQFCTLNSILHCMHRLSTLFVALCLGLVPVVSHAAFWDILQGDLNAYEQYLRSESGSTALWNTILERENQEYPFPLLPGEEQEASVIEQQQQERTAQYVTVQIGSKNVTFGDLPNTAWFAPYVRDALDYGYMSGYADEEGNPLGIFRPERDVSIEEVAKVAVLASGKDLSACDQELRNPTASGSWSVPYVQCAEQWEWLVYGDGAVDVKKPATRAEVINTMLEAFAVQPNFATGESFDDVNATTQFAGAIETAAKDGIVNGYTDEQNVPTGEFGPGDSITRAAFAKMVVLAVMTYGNEE